MPYGPPFPWVSQMGYALSHSAGDLYMICWHLKLATAAAAASVLFSNSIAAPSDSYSAKQELAPAPKAARVRITQGPSLEMADGNSAIIRWRSDNPGGSDEHYGVVHMVRAPGNSARQRNPTSV